MSAPALRRLAGSNRVVSFNPKPSGPSECPRAPGHRDAQGLQPLSSGALGEPGSGSPCPPGGPRRPGRGRSRGSPAGRGGLRSRAALESRGAWPAAAPPNERSGCFKFPCGPGWGSHPRTCAFASPAPPRVAMLSVRVPLATIADPQQLQLSPLKGLSLADKENTVSARARGPGVGTGRWGPVGRGRAPHHASPCSPRPSAGPACWPARPPGGSSRSPPSRCVGERGAPGEGALQEGGAGRSLRLAPKPHCLLSKPAPTHPGPLSFPAKSLPDHSPRGGMAYFPTYSPAVSCIGHIPDSDPRFNPMKFPIIGCT